MKHSKLHGVAHNCADSLSGGQSFVIPNQVIAIDVYAEASANGSDFLVVDLLKGRVEGARPESDVEYATPLFKNAFPEFCDKHGVDVSDYGACLVRYFANDQDAGYVVTIEDRDGRRTSREYQRHKGKRSKTLDAKGRPRPKHLASPLD